MQRDFFELPILPGMHPEYGLLASLLQDSTREWRAELGSLSPEGLVWQPFPGGYSVGAILLHIASVESYWIERFCLDMELDESEHAELLSRETDVDNVQWPTPPLKPLSYFYDLQDRVRDRTMRHLANLPEPSTSRDRPNSSHTMAWVVGHVIGHDSYHGGQAVLLKELFQRRV